MPQKLNSRLAAFGFSKIVEVLTWEKAIFSAAPYRP
jgi:hypothetical protein